MLLKLMFKVIGVMLFYFSVWVVFLRETNDTSMREKKSKEEPL